MGKIANLPILDRPREKAMKYGISSLSDQELLSIILGTGYIGTSVNELSSIILDTFGGLTGLTKVSLASLKKIKGISHAKALSLLTVFEINKRLSEEPVKFSISFLSLITKYQKKLSQEHQEHLVLIGVNRMHNLLVERTIYIGTNSEIVVAFQDIFRVALEYHCFGFYLIHNHPGASPKPSSQDILLTDEIEKGGKLLGLKMLDHIIIGENGYYSFKNAEKPEKS